MAENKWVTGGDDFWTYTIGVVTPFMVGFLSYRSMDVWILFNDMWQDSKGKSWPSPVHSMRQGARYIYQQGTHGSWSTHFTTWISHVFPLKKHLAVEVTKPMGSPTMPNPPNQIYFLLFVLKKKTCEQKDAASQCEHRYQFMLNCILYFTP